jgi:glucosamine-6-phosphate deaminase
MIFATGASQLSMLAALTALPGLPWDRTTGFHLDEYVNLPAEHPASFRRYLREHLIQRVSMKQFHEIDGSAADTERECRSYEAKLKKASPKLCVLGVGENGHLAFNEPGDANFRDPVDVRPVKLDRECREQQVAEGWFPDLEAVPANAITVTIPALFRVPRLILSVPGGRKAKIMRRLIEEEISTACPATILKKHPNATVYLDPESAAGLGDLSSLQGLL